MTQVVELAPTKHLDSGGYPWGGGAEPNLVALLLDFLHCCVANLLHSTRVLTISWTKAGRSPLVSGSSLLQHALSHQA